MTTWQAYQISAFIFRIATTILRLSWILAGRTFLFAINGITVLQTFSLCSQNSTQSSRGRVCYAAHYPRNDGIGGCLTGFPSFRRSA